MRHVPSGDETRDALAAVLQDQANRKERQAAPPPKPRDRSRIARWAAAPLGGVALWLLLSPPAVVRPSVPAPTPEAVNAGLHMDIYVAAAQVIAYRDRNGTLPEVLADAMAEPEAAEGLTYVVSMGDFFEIRGERAGQRVVYYSNRSLSEFVAVARATIRVGAPGGGGGGSF